MFVPDNVAVGSWNHNGFASNGIYPHTDLYKHRLLLREERSNKLHKRSKSSENTSKATPKPKESGLDKFVKKNLTLLLVFGSVFAFLLFLTLHLAVICLICKKRDSPDRGSSSRRDRATRGRRSSTSVESGRNDERRKRHRERSPGRRPSRDGGAMSMDERVKHRSRRRQRDRKGSFSDTLSDTSHETDAKRHRRRGRDADRDRHRNRSPNRKESRPTAKIVPTSRTRLLSSSVHSAGSFQVSPPLKKMSSTLGRVPTREQLGPVPSFQAPAPPPPAPPSFAPAPPPPGAPPPPLAPPSGPGPPPPPAAAPMYTQQQGTCSHCSDPYSFPTPTTAQVPPVAAPAPAPPSFAPPAPPSAAPPPPPSAAPPPPPASAPPSFGPPAPPSSGCPPPPPPNMPPSPAAPTGGNLMSQLNQGTALRPTPGPAAPRPLAPKPVTHEDALMAAVAKRRLKISSSTMLNNNNSILLSDSEAIALARAFPGIFSPKK